MSLAGWLLGRLAFGTSPFGLGFALVGTLPTDVSSPLLVYIARGNVTLATVASAINTALAPILVPALFLLYTGVELDVPVAALMVENRDAVHHLQEGVQHRGLRRVASGLPPEVALPAVVFAVVQMITSPLVAKAIARRALTVEPDERR